MLHARKNSPLRQAEVFQARWKKLTVPHRLLTGEPAAWLDTVFSPCAHVPLVTVVGPASAAGWSAKTKSTATFPSLLHRCRERARTNRR